MNKQPQDSLKPYLRERIRELQRNATNHIQYKAPNPLEIYTEKIRTWLKHLTPEQLGRSYTISEIITLSGLKGITNPKASVQLTGEALRRCGLLPVRDWSKNGRNKRYWKAEKHD